MRCNTVNNDNYNDLIKKEIDSFANEAEELNEDEKYHCSDLSEVELKTKTDERSYYIELKDNNGKVLDTIYVDRHDYLLYKRPIWREWKKEQLEKRCLIPAKNSAGYKRCMEDCEKCPFFRSGKPASLDAMKAETKFEPADDSSLDPKELSLFNEANKLLWNVIKSVSTEEQFKKIKLYFKEGLTYQKIGDIYGVSHKAIEKAIKTALAKAKEEISEDDYYFLAKYLLK